MATNRAAALQRFSSGVRRQLLWILISFGICAALAWYYREDAFAFMLAPSRGLLSPTGGPIFTSPTEMFSATIRLSVTFGIIGSLPMVMVSISRTLIPFLLSGERRFIFWFFLPTALLCAFAGLVFAYYALLPVGLNFLLNFGAGVAAPMIRISEYMSLATLMLLWMAVVFELPLMMYVLSRLRVVHHSRMRRIRKYVPPTALIFAAIITPPDGLTTLLIAFPMWMLYEVGLFLAWMGRPREQTRLNTLRTALIEAVFLSVVMAGVVGLLWYAGVIGGR